MNLEDAENYCKWLSSKTGENFSLPTEAEWIRAAILDNPHHIGYEKLYPWGEEKPVSKDFGQDAKVKYMANFEADFGGPTLVGLFENGRTAMGCYDMGGNVWEWCTDYLSDDSPLRVLKGGSYFFSADDMLICNKKGALNTQCSPFIGFRIIKRK